MMPTAWKFILIALAGWIHRQQEDVIEYFSNRRRGIPLGLVPDLLRPKQEGAGVCVIITGVSGQRHRIRHRSKLFVELSVGHDGNLSVGPDGASTMIRLPRFEQKPAQVERESGWKARGRAQHYRRDLPMLYVGSRSYNRLPAVLVPDLPEGCQNSFPPE